MKLIVAVDNNWGIGKNNKLLISLPEDMAFFREQTQHSLVIMGYNTLLSLPNSAPLKGRLNIVLAPEIDKEDERFVHYDNLLIAHNLKEVFNAVENVDMECYVIGGAQTYKTFLPYCSYAYITHINKNFEADTFFPVHTVEWQQNYEKELSDMSVNYQKSEKENIPFYFAKYKNKNVKQFKEDE